MSDIRKHLDHNNNVICDVCGKKRKRSECMLGYGAGDIAIIMSCLDGCVDYRHPLNSPPPLIYDAQPVPDSRPDQGFNQETFITFSISSFMTWSHFVNTGKWSKFNYPNLANINLNGVWTWGQFVRV